MRRPALLVALLATTILRAQDVTDAQHAKLEIELNPTLQTVAGTATWTFKSLVNGLTSVELQLHSQLGVSSATVGGVATTFTRPTDRVVVALDRPYATNEIFTVAVAYSGSPAGAGFGSFIWSSHGAGTAMVFSLSEPFYAYTWWPAKESNVDKFTSETWITVPDWMTAASNGVLQGTDVIAGNKKRFRWASSYPIATYGVSLAATDYQTRTDTYTHLGASMPIEFYAFPENFAAEQTNMSRIATMIQVFSDLCGQYPFVNEKYGICQFTWGGGMEHQTMTSQLNFSENLSSHELGHSWWGNMVTCATWNDIGINEGFATYMEALWDEFKPGGGVTAYFSRMNTNRPSSPTTSGSVWVTNPTSVNAIFNTNTSYRKGAWVLHQLRHIVGDTAFFQILRDYRAAKEFQSATWNEFGTIASQSFGEDLTWYIQQAVMRTGAPRYSLGWATRSFAGQNFVVGSITQTQGGTAFRFPIDLRATTGAGTPTLVAWNDQTRDDFIIPVPATATAVSLDPGPWILKGTNQSATYVPSLSASPASIPRTGGTVTFTLDAGTSNANRPFLIGGSATGVWPGVVLPDKKRVPLEVDTFTVAALQVVNTPVFQNFSGTLDSLGRATATLNLPALGPIGAPLTGDFSFITTTAPVFVSIPVAITVTP